MVCLTTFLLLAKYGLPLLVFNRIVETVFSTFLVRIPRIGLIHSIVASIAALEIGVLDKLISE